VGTLRPRLFLVRLGTGTGGTARDLGPRRSYSVAASVASRKVYCPEVGFPVEGGVASADVDNSLAFGVNGLLFVRLGSGSTASKLSRVCLGGALFATGSLFAASLARLEMVRLAV
jgi:hypothetical protein